MAEGQLRFAEITGRGKPKSLAIVSPADFRTAEWMLPPPSVDLEKLIPYCLDVANERTLYVRAGGTKAVLRATFQYVHLRESATGILSVPWVHGRLTDRAAPSPRIAFSVGRCGSTLLVEAMRRAGVLAISEPDYFTQAVAALRFMKSEPKRQENLARVLQNVTNDMLAAFNAAPSHPALIKLRAECCRAPGLIVATSGSASALFLIREFASWAASTLKVTTLSPARVVARYLQGLLCLQWLSRHCECHLVTYEDLVARPEQVVSGAARALGMTTDPGRVKSALRVDSQAGSPLARQRLGTSAADQRSFAATLELWREHRPVEVLKEVGLAGYS